jgi:hypothetical protein
MEYVNLNNIKKKTIFKGFGTSLCWFANVIGKSDDKESVDKLCNMLFNKNNPYGLHLNFVRYCIGGVEHKKLAKNFRIGGAIEAYVGKEWSNIDIGQRYFLKKAKEYGVENFEAFSNSPLNSMTVSGSTAGSNPWEIPFIKQNITFSNNLKNEYIEDFAKYLVNVTKYLSEHDNINFSSISPMNEALNPGWVSNNNQEGCYYNLFGIRGKLFNSLRKELDKQGLSHVNIAGCEENNMFFGFLGLIFNTEHIQQFNVHRYQCGNALGFNTYGFEDSNIFRYMIRWILKDKPIVMSEFGLGFLNGITDSKDFQNVLLLADKIMDDFNYLQPEAWVYWQCFDTNGWGLCNVDFNNPSKVLIGALYKAIQHFSHFIKVGYRLLELPKLKNRNLKWIGSINEKTKETTLVILSSNITLKFNKYFSNSIISISNSNNFKCDNNLVRTTILGDINSLIIPSNSLVSVLLKNEF